MRWFLEFTFSSPLHFIGMIILFAVALDGLTNIARAIRGRTVETGGDAKEENIG